MALGLRFAELPCTSDEGMWIPFGMSADAHDGFRSDWWAKPIWGARGRSPLFVMLDSDDTQVARLRFDWAFPEGVYPSADAARVRPFLEIQFIEVHSAYRCRDVGTLMVRSAEAEFPNRQLMALSEKADGFWSSLGWTRHRHGEDDGTTEHYHPLYLSS